MKRRKKGKRREMPQPKVFVPDSPQLIGELGEKNLRKKTGCVLTPGSGRGSIKGDGLHDFKRVFEKKTTKSKSIRIKKDDLEKLEMQAGRREAVMVIEFEVQRFGSRQWAVVPLNRLLELYELEDEGGG